MSHVTLALTLFVLALLCTVICAIAETCILSQTRTRTYSHIGLLRLTRKADRLTMPLALGAYLCWPASQMPSLATGAALASGAVSFAWTLLNGGKLLRAGVLALTAGPLAAIAVAFSISGGAQGSGSFLATAAALVCAALTVGWLRDQQNLHAWRD